MADKPVWACIYTHKYGVDVGIYPTRDAACKGACFVALEYLSNVDDAEVRKEVVELAEEGNHEGATLRYSEAAGEDFEILLITKGEVDDEAFNKALARAEHGSRTTETDASSVHTPTRP